MELDHVEGGFIEYEVLLAMTLDEVKQLRHAMAVARAHVNERYLNGDIFDDFLEVTEGL